MTNNLLTEGIKERISLLSQNPNIQTMEDLLENLSLDFSQLSFDEKGKMLHETDYIKATLRYNDPNDPAIKLYELLKIHLHSVLSPAPREDLDKIKLGKLVSRDLLASKLSENRYDN